MNKSPIPTLLRNYPFPPVPILSGKGRGFIKALSFWRRLGEALR
jgi:hypothetical protein